MPDLRVVPLTLPDLGVLPTDFPVAGGIVPGFGIQGLGDSGGQEGPGATSGVAQQDGTTAQGGTEGIGGADEMPLPAGGAASSWVNPAAGSDVFVTVPVPTGADPSLARLGIFSLSDSVPLGREELDSEDIIAAWRPATPPSHLTACATASLMQGLGLLGPRPQIHWRDPPPHWDLMGWPQLLPRHTKPTVPPAALPVRVTSSAVVLLSRSEVKAPWPADKPGGRPVLMAKLLSVVGHRDQVRERLVSSLWTLPPRSSPCRYRYRYRCSPSGTSPTNY